MLLLVYVRLETCTPYRKGCCGPAFVKPFCPLFVWSSKFGGKCPALLRLFVAAPSLWGLGNASETPARRIQNSKP